MKNNKSNIDLYHQYKAIKKFNQRPKHKRILRFVFSNFGIWIIRCQTAGPYVNFSRQEAAELIPKSNHF